MLFKSALVTQISGSIGGMTGSHNRGGLYFRSRAVPTDPNTPAQAAIRAVFGALVNRWVNTLNAFQRQGWINYANQVPLTGPLGDPITVSGQNMYIRSNTPRSQIAASIIDTAPSIFDTGTLSLVTASNASEATQDVDFTFSNSDAWNVANGHLIIQQSRPVNPTIDFFRGPYRLMNSFEGPQVSPVTGPAVFPFVAGQRLFFRARASLADGRLTQSQFIGPLLTIA